MKKFNIGGNAIINLAMIGLGVVQTVMGNKKQSNDIAALKEAVKLELKDELVKDIMESIKNGN